MKIIIAGAGEVGSHLARMLSDEDQDIILLDTDPERLEAMDSNYNLMTWSGSTSSFETMRDMGMAEADLYIAVTPYETRNITSCAIAKRLGAKKTVARIDNPEFLDDKNRRILKEIGVDTLIYPENLAADEIAKALRYNWARYWGELHDGRLLLIGVKIRGNCELADKMLMELPRDQHNFHVVAIKRGGETIIPGGRDYILNGDLVYFITTPDHVEVVRNMCGKQRRKIESVFIVGGSPITVRFAKKYGEQFDVKIIDLNYQRCEQLATDMPYCEIIHGDGRNVTLLRDNHVDNYDAFLSLTGSSETNILACLTAKEFGIRKTIAEVENIQFISQAENLNIGTTVNKKLLASSYIFQLLLDADTESAKCLALANAEAAEMQVKDGAKITKSPVKDLRLPREMTLAAVFNDDRIELVSGNTQISPGDHVVFFCLHGYLHKAEKWFG